MSERQDTLTKVLNYVDSPFKLFALILMAILAFAGYIVYDHRELIVGTYKEHQKLPQIAEGRVDDAATHLFKHTNAAPCWSGVDADDRLRERHRVRRSNCITAMQFCQE